MALTTLPVAAVLDALKRLSAEDRQSVVVHVQRLTRLPAKRRAAIILLTDEDDE